MATLEEELTANQAQWKSTAQLIVDAQREVPPAVRRTIHAWGLHRVLTVLWLRYALSGW